MARKNVCSKCGEKKDRDGYCPNYCQSGKNEMAATEAEAGCLDCGDTGLKECGECVGTGKGLPGELCEVCNGYGTVRCMHQGRV